MISIRFDDKQFLKDMNNILGYSEGFLEGVKKARLEILQNFSMTVKEFLEEYLDSMARIDPAQLQHVYEWAHSGNREARLFDISYTSTVAGISLGYEFRQSTSIKNGSSVPFYDKARIMEFGIPVTIKPVRSQVLAFEVDGETRFSKGPITVTNPGGDDAFGSFERTFNEFFKSGLSQSLLESSGIKKYLENPVEYKRNISAGKRLGKSKGISTGYDWAKKAGKL